MQRNTLRQLVDRVVQIYSIFSEELDFYAEISCRLKLGGEGQNIFLVSLPTLSRESLWLSLFAPLHTYIATSEAEKKMLCYLLNQVLSPPDHHWLLSP